MEVKQEDVAEDQDTWFEVFWNLMCVAAWDEHNGNELDLVDTEIQTLIGTVDLTDERLDTIVTRVVKIGDPTSPSLYISLPLPDIYFGLSPEEKELAKIASTVVAWSEFLSAGECAEFLEQRYFNGAYFEDLSPDGRNEQRLFALLFSEYWGHYGRIFKHLINNNPFSFHDISRHLYVCYEHVLSCEDIICILKETIEAPLPTAAQIRAVCIDMLVVVNELGPSADGGLYISEKICAAIINQMYDTFFEKDFSKLLQFLERTGDIKRMTKVLLDAVFRRNLNKRQMDTLFSKMQMDPSSFFRVFHQDRKWPLDRILTLMNTYQQFGNVNYATDILEQFFLYDRSRFDDFAISFTNLRPKEFVERTVQSYSRAYEFLLAIATASEMVQDSVPAHMVAHLLRLLYPPRHESAETACTILFHRSMPPTRLQSILPTYLDYDPNAFGFLLSRVSAEWAIPQVASLMLAIHSSDPRLHLQKVFPVFPSFCSLSVVAEYIAEFVKSDLGLVQVPALIWGHYVPLEKYAKAVKLIVSMACENKECEERMKGVQRFLGLMEPKIVS